MYEDCLTHCIGASAPLPQWYLQLDDAQIVGCAGLITNDFISRGELYPWLCALYIEENFRCTDLAGYYEKYDFEFMGMGYHPWGETSRVYGKTVM